MKQFNSMCACILQYSDSFKIGISRIFLINILLTVAVKDNELN